MTFGRAAGQRRWALVALASWPATLAGVQGASAQTPAPEPARSAPSLQIVSAALTQRGEQLRLALRFDRPVPVEQLDPSSGRTICLVLSPDVASRRRVCVSRPGGRLRATIKPVDVEGRAIGRPIVLRRARIVARGALLSVQAPARSLRVRIGRPLAWQALVTWRDGSPCELTPGPRRCTQVVPGTGARTLRTRGPRGPSFARNGHLRVLATGDSMIQIVDGLLERRLERRRGASVRSDARISTGISKPSLLNWVRKAREQARSVHPDVSVVFLGANDGFPMKLAGGASVRCCGPAWIAEYRRRVESMMRAYLRGGRALVYWLTLPAPRRGDFARVYRAVNTAIRRAGRRVGGGARVVDLVPVFTPGGRFRQHVTFRGRTYSARQPDGVHLSVAGAAIAATLLIDRLRADRALPRLR